MLSNQVRQVFIDYFVRNGHRHVPSSSLIPYGDRTLLFTNAGMNQFKDVFLGLEQRDYTRAVTAQKVMRVSGKHNDLDNIGYTRRHHTFFEMLGNFSFGDYFKDEAMGFALELLEKEYGFPRERMWFTIFEEDDESYTLWQKHGIPASRILRFGEKDNFWSMGPTGPCGPNSEIHIYTGDLRDNDARWVNNDNDPEERTSEVWNLVFMQFNRSEDGTLTPLPRTGVDTGMGFERLVRLIQGGDSNYDSDLFIDIFERIQALTGHTNEQRMQNIVPYRVIADHARASAFLIGDGVLPGNEGRNYVLRMIMRRAMRFGRKIGLTQPFLYQVADAVIDKMGGYYTELSARRAYILDTIHREEERFARTLDQGLERLREMLQDGSALAEGETRTISGEAAFKLYDTYGLPLEITRDEARELGLRVDEAGFQAARQRAKELARAAAQGLFEGDYGRLLAYQEALAVLKADGLLPAEGVRYDPYTSLTLDTQIAGILRDGELTRSAVKGETVEVVLKETPFYVESGGQVSDTGLICARTNPDTEEEPAWCLAVKDTRRPIAGLVVHQCIVEWGEPAVGDACTAQVDEARRWAIMRNHTATHLLQAALRAVLGTHVRQEGSLVAPDRLRFDFSHSAPLSESELQQVTEVLNDAILDNLPVTASYMPYQQAIQAGALAFFSEKYGDVVRVVRVGSLDQQPFSLELCGGTHVEYTGDIGSALIVSEGALSAGIRRIEVVTGRYALNYAQNQARLLGEAAQLLGVPAERVVEQTRKVLIQLQEAQKALEQVRRELARLRFDEVMRRAQTVDGVALLVAEVSADTPDLLREMSDWFRAKHPRSAVALGAVIEDKPALLVALSSDLTQRGLDASKVVREAAALVGGGGGGRPTLAQAGGRDPSRLSEALAKADQLLREALARSASA
ncbi:MAG: alanine--tRNA ligase [Anaerolineae bacterium]|nr:alanine--tRNA ligase [Thermoflexales bacterium]MDW8394625.1 alanine--tRNA ligase [Anaerolineae bacterium]